MPETQHPPSLSDITDPVYRTKFVTLPDIITSWVKPWMDVRDAQILDFGCGEATTALGFALGKGPRRVVGVDVVSDPDLCLPYAQKHLKLNVLPPNLELHKVVPGTLHNESDRFDLVYAWSVIEHVREDILVATLSMLHGRLRDGGLIFIQISPLYYSSEGSHMCHKVPERWGHLRHQHSEYLALIRQACDNEAEYRALVETYETLNRITAPRLIAAIRKAGFVVEREHYRHEEFEIPPEVVEAYDPKVLRLAEIVVLARRLTAQEVGDAWAIAERFEAANKVLTAENATLRAHIAAIEMNTKTFEMQAAEAEGRAASAAQRLNAIEESTTWRLAKPLQRLIGKQPRLGSALRKIL